MLRCAAIDLFARLARISKLVDGSLYATKSLGRLGLTMAMEYSLFNIVVLLDKKMDEEEDWSLRVQAWDLIYALSHLTDVPTKTGCGSFLCDINVLNRLQKGLSDMHAPPRAL